MYIVYSKEEANGFHEQKTDVDINSASPMRNTAIRTKYYDLPCGSYLGNE